jgi:undecaprenyl-diphosphatase
VWFAAPLLGAFLVTLALKAVAAWAGWPMRAPMALLSYTAPSGHAGMSAAVYGGAALLATRGMPGPAALVIRGGVALVVVMVAVSRLVLTVHGLGDVVAGLAIGAIAADWAARATPTHPAALWPGRMLLLLGGVAAAMLGSGLRFESARWL